MNENNDKNKRIMAKDKDTQFENIGKEMPYTVPGGFFEKQQDLLCGEVASLIKKRKRRAATFKISIALAAAACLAALLIPLATGNGITQGSPEPSQPLAMAAAAHPDSAKAESQAATTAGKSNGNEKAITQAAKAKKTTANDNNNRAATATEDAIDEAESGDDEEMNDDIYLISLQYE